MCDSHLETENDLNDVLAAMGMTRMENTHIRRFVFAGMAIFTVLNTATGNRFTFKVEKAKPRKCRRCQGTGLYANGGHPSQVCFSCKGTGAYKADSQPFFVSVLNGPDNLNSYAYMGLVDADQATAERPRLRFTAKSKVTAEAQSARVFAWVMAHMDVLPAPVEFYHAGKCGRCGRTLTTPESIETGIGPVCAGKV